MKRKFYTLLLSALALMFTNAAQAETVNHSLYFGQNESSGAWSLYTDASHTTEYAENTEKWGVSENTLTLTNFDFSTSATTVLTLMSGSVIILEGTNTIETTAANGRGLQSTDLTVKGPGSLIVSTSTTAESAGTVAGILVGGKLIIDEGANVAAITGETEARMSIGIRAGKGMEVKGGAKVTAIGGKSTNVNPQSCGINVFSSGGLTVEDNSVVIAQGYNFAISAFNGEINGVPNPETTSIYASTDYNGVGAMANKITIAEKKKYQVDGKDALWVMIVPNIKDGWKEKAKNYIVDSQEGLAELADIVNNGNDMAGCTIIQTANIALKAGDGMDATKGWTPVGSYIYPVKAIFDGTFDGNGHKITGLWITDTDGQNLGLFGYLGRNSIVQNLGIEIKNKVEGNAFIGGLAGESNGKISNCYVSGNVKHSGNNVGLLVGKSQGSIDNCYVLGNVETDSRNSGGLAGIAATISTCYSAATVAGTSNTTVGGLVNTISSGGKVENSVVISPSLVGAGSRYVCRTVYSNGGTLSNNHAWVGNIPDEEGGTFVHDGLNGANWSGEMTDAPIDGWNANGEVWLIDETGKTMPKLAVFGDNQPTVLNPKKQSSESNYRTINLEVASGIWCDYQAGNLTVVDGGHLYLQFRAEEDGMTADDILFLVDGVETEFRTFNEDNYYGYILTSIHQNHTILIAFRDYPVTITEMEGVTCSVGTGEHQVAYGSPFRFSLTFDDSQDTDKVHVFANDIEIMPEALRAGGSTLSYTIDKVIGPIVVTADGIDPVGNIQLSTSNFQLSTAPGQLIIDNGGVKAADVMVYTVSGQNVASLRGLHGSKTITLRPGIYLVRAAGKVYKVSVN